MNTKNNVPPSSELIQIGGIGFMFEVRTTLKHNLISPDILAFFDGVPESGDITENSAFSHAINKTNLCKSIFQDIGYDWVVCSDGIFRKCQKIKCNLTINKQDRSVLFYVDISLANSHINGIAVN